MSKLRNIVRAHIDNRVRDSFYVLRTRRDATLLADLIRTGLRMHHQAQNHKVHLEAAMNWLCAAHNATRDDGIAAFYDARSGSWGPSYPETSGYIIPTFLNYARLNSLDAYHARAVRVADWLMTLQLDDGGFPIGPLWSHWERKPIVFDTGQIVHGLVSIFEETGNLRYLQSARRAADWLVSVQDEDGSWRKYTSQGYVHTYNVRVAWALIRVGNASGEKIYRLAAKKNLAWTLTQQTADGWFQNAAFAPGEAPLTHTIAYTIRGLLESGILLADHELIDAAVVAADALKQRQIEDGQLHARYGPGWRVTDDSSCLTGNAQMAIVWLRLYGLNGSSDYLQVADAVIDYLKRTQNCQSGNEGIAGGLAGSFPLYGPYEPYRYLNWAAKFFADSLMLRIQTEAAKRSRSATLATTLPTRH